MSVEFHVNGTSGEVWPREDCGIAMRDAYLIGDNHSLKAYVEILKRSKDGECEQIPVGEIFPRDAREAAAAIEAVGYDEALYSPLVQLADQLRGNLISQTVPHHTASGTDEVIDLSAATVSYAKMLELNIPPRKEIIPWLKEKSLAMVFGSRGVGKTQFAIGLATAIATGRKFLEWQIESPTGVLYVDGEMPLDELRERFKGLAGNAQPENLHLLSGDLVYNTLGQDLILTGEAMQGSVVRVIEQLDEIGVVIIDNVSCLFTGLNEDRKQDWEAINAWLIRLRHRGLAVVLVHHAGKTGQQRGTSAREDALDVVIALSKPEDYSPEEGCHFHLNFTKARSVKGEIVRPLDVRLAGDSTSLHFEAQPLEQTYIDRVRELIMARVTSPTEIGEMLGISKGYASKLKKKIDSDG